MKKNVIIVNSLADIEIARFALSNHLSFLFSCFLDDFFRQLKGFNVEIHVRMIFERISRGSPFNTLDVERRIAIDESLSMIRGFLKFNIDFKLIDGYNMREELRNLKKISNPLYEKCMDLLIEE